MNFLPRFPLHRDNQLYLLLTEQCTSGVQEDVHESILGQNQTEVWDSCSLSWK